MKRISHLESAIPSIEGVICDLWGVIHDGRRVFEDATGALKALRGKGIPVAVLSNSPRTAAAVDIQVRSLGAGEGWSDFLVTSGDLARAHMEALGRGVSFFHLGPPRDRPTIEGLPNPKTETLEEADVVLCTGFFEDQGFDPDLYRKLLKGPAAAGKLMVCANPDKAVNIGGEHQLCAGAIAEVYEAMGGSVIRLGKPEQIAYDKCLELLSGAKGRRILTRRVLAIGDNLETDIAGAKRLGITTLLITEGLHARAEKTAGGLEKLVREAGVRPDFIAERLVW